MNSLALTLTSFQKSGSAVSAAPACAMRDGDEINSGLIAPESAHNSQTSRNTTSVPPPIRYRSFVECGIGRHVTLTRHSGARAKPASPESITTNREYGFRTRRGACHRAGHFGPDPLASIRNDSQHDKGKNNGRE